MRHKLLLLCVAGAFLTAAAKDIMKVRVISDADRRPVAFTSLAVEYPDTIMTHLTDRKGKLKFTPRSFPLTVTAHAEGMLDATYGLMSMPDGTVTIEIAPNPAATRPPRKRRVDWSSDRPPRLSSTYVVRTPAGK